jgi:hypothetical protein
MFCMFVQVILGGKGLNHIIIWLDLLQNSLIINPLSTGAILLMCKIVWS